MSMMTLKNLRNKEHRVPLPSWVNHSPITMAPAELSFGEVPNLTGIIIAFDLDNTLLANSWENKQVIGRGLSPWASFSPPWVSEFFRRIRGGRYFMKIWERQVSLSSRGLGQAVVCQWHWGVFEVLSFLHNAGAELVLVTASVMKGLLSLTRHRYWCPQFLKIG